MSDPYAQKLTNKNFFHAKTDMSGSVVVVLDGRLENRGLHLIQPISRAFPRGSIIELIGTTDVGAAPGAYVEAISYIAFVELTTGGVLLAGDEFLWNGSVIGTIAGFDDTHMPNHQNTIVLMKERRSGKDIGLHAGDTIVVKGF